MTGRRELWEATRFDSIDEVFDAAFSANGAGANGRGPAATARIGAPFNPQGKDLR
jgi:hypothetical protein